MQNTRQDGMGIAITGANAMEQYEQMEVVNGLGASYYGPANPSGMFNFVLKRPTEQRTENISLEYDSKSIGTVYGDFGGRFGPNNIFGYRSNLLYREGGTYVADSHLRRRLADFAFNVRPTDKTLIDASYSVYDILQRGYPGWFTYGLNSKATGTPKPSLILPAAPDPIRVGYGQSYAGVNLTTQSASARLHPPDQVFAMHYMRVAQAEVERVEAWRDMKILVVLRALTLELPIAGDDQTIDPRQPVFAV